MDAFYWVIDWEGMISVSSLVGLLEKHFFPKWLQVHPALLCLLRDGLEAERLHSVFCRGLTRSLILGQLSDNRAVICNINKQ